MTEKVLGPIVEPDWRDVFDKFKDVISSSINCVQIATVDSFNPLTCTANVEINFKRKLADGRVIEYPKFSDCPVFILNGGGAFLSFPITQGDTCLVLFNDRDLDSWFLSGEITTPNSSRTHSFSDAIVLVGIRPLPSILSVDTALASLNGGEHLIQIKNAAASLKTLVDGLIDDIIALTTTNCVVGNPVVLSPATIAALEARKLQFTTLLGE